MIPVFYYYVLTIPECINCTLISVFLQSESGAIGFGATLWFQHSLGFLEHIPCV